MRNLFSIVGRTVLFKSGGGLLATLIVVVSLSITLLLSPSFQSPTEIQNPVIFQTTEEACSTKSDPNTCNDTSGCFFSKDMQSCFAGTPGPNCGTSNYCFTGFTCITSGPNITTSICINNHVGTIGAWCKNFATASGLPEANNDACNSRYCNPSTYQCAQAPSAPNPNIPTPTNNPPQPPNTPQPSPIPVPFCTPGTQCSGINLNRGDFYSYVNPDPSLRTPFDCQGACQEDSNCRAWTFQHDNLTCWEKSSVPAANFDNNTTSGIKVGGSSNPPPPPTTTCNGAQQLLCNGQCYGLSSAKTNWTCNPTGPSLNIPPTTPPTITPTRTPTAAPTIRPTVTTQPNSPTATAAPNQPTATIGAGSTNLALSLTLDGVGSNTATGQNNNPQPSSRTVSVTIHDSAGTEIKNGSGTLTYDSASSSFKGNVPLSGIANGTYQIKVRFDNTLKKAINAVNISSGTTANVAVSKLVTGDIDQNNELNLADYNAIISCYGNAACSQKVKSDLTMDGKVDELDLNVLYSQFETRLGD